MHRRQQRRSNSFSRRLKPFRLLRQLSVHRKEKILGRLLLPCTAVRAMYAKWSTWPDLRLDLLKDETTELDLVGPTLQALKGILERPANYSDPENKYGRVVHGLLSSCLVNIDEMRSVLADVWDDRCANDLIVGDKGPCVTRRSRATFLLRYSYSRYCHPRSRLAGL